MGVPPEGYAHLAKERAGVVADNRHNGIVGRTPRLEVDTRLDEPCGGHGLGRTRPADDQDTVGKDCLR